MSFKIRGTGPGDIQIPEQNAVVSENKLTISDAESSGAFKGEVDFFDPMTIQWQCRIENVTDWFDVGTSENQVYVTFRPPVLSETSYHTVVHRGCEKAKGHSDEEAIIQKIWSVFAGPNPMVYRVDGQVLTYYQSYTVDGPTFYHLLQYADGDCRAWASLFLEMLLAQGINPYKPLARIRPASVGAQGLLVQIWEFNEPGIVRLEDFPEDEWEDLREFSYLNIAAPLKLVDIETNDYSWIYTDVIYSEGTTGQGGVKKPAAVFNFHELVYIDGVFYDPSYGITFGRKGQNTDVTLRQIEEHMIAGYHRFNENWFFDENNYGIDLNGNGIIDKFSGFALFMRKVDDALGLKYQPSYYILPAD